MSKQIIVIDDSRTARQQVCATLRDAGYEIIEGVDGRDGLAQIVAHPLAALVVCDLNMPVLNGLEMLTLLRAEHPAITVPVVMLTTEAQPALLQRAKAAGAKGWIVKPFKPEMLLAAVRKLCEPT